MKKTGMKISISKLLIVSNCAVTAVFFAMHSYLTTRSYERVLEEEFRSKQNQMLVYISDTIGEAMKSIELLARSTANNHTVINQLTNYQEHKNSYEQLVFQNNMSQNLSSVAYSLGDIVSVNILMDDSGLRTTKANGVYSYESYTTDGYADRIREQTADWLPTRENDLVIPSYTRYITTYVQRVYSNLYDGEAIGHLVINLDEKMFYDLIASYSRSGKESILVFDGTGNIISSTDRQMMGKRMQDTGYAAYLDGKEDWQAGKIVSQKQIDGRDMYVLAVSDYGSAVAPIADTQRLVGLTSLALLFGLSLFGGLLAYQISKPILLLSREVKRYRGEGWEHKISTDSHIYEINILGAAFNHMADKIETLIKSLLRQEELKQKQELEILQAQINPHFLYNTLEAINWMALSMKQKEISRMVILLGTFLRLSLNKGKNVYLVRDELNHLQCYLDIQNIRCKGKIMFSSEVEKEIMDCRIIKLLLQPLVENSILHGFDASGGTGHIWLRAYREGKTLCFCVTDDGCGMTPELIERICDPASETGHGLKNVIRRISLYYGEGYGLSIHSAQGVGTTIEIKIADDISKQ